ncbi:MAG: hypothetical protein RRC34_03915 [Lentisphaeria bacterium]|nr:hypothetical protein [Lentisphaeria bacterium]
MAVKDRLLRKATAPRNNHHGAILSCSADAIEKFLDVEEEIDLPEDVAVESGETFEQDYWECGGTTVSMRPDMLLYKKAEDGTRDVVGAVKFSFSKTNPVGEEGCDYLSTALWRHLVDNCGHNADRDCCFAIDIPSGVVATPGKSYKRKIDNIRAACEEIADRWDKV